MIYKKNYDLRIITDKINVVVAYEHTCLTELEALAEIIGPYGIRFMGEKLMDQISGQVKEIKKLVVLNQDTLLALHTNRDKPDIFNEVMRKVKSESTSLMLQLV